MTIHNILLDELDKELETRGHRFCRYADDCNIYVQTEVAGKRVMRSVTRYLEVRLKLKVNREKSAVSRPSKRKFLGYSFTPDRKARLRVAPESRDRLQAKIREWMRLGRGRSLAHLIAKGLTPLLRGWANYFRLVQVKETFEALDKWIRRKLRVVLWRQWGNCVARYRNLVRLGIRPDRAKTSAWNGRGPWWNAGTATYEQRPAESLLR